jgi:hypothetical protein
MRAGISSFLCISKPLSSEESYLGSNFMERKRILARGFATDSVRSVAESEYPTADSGKKLQARVLTRTSQRYLDLTQRAGWSECIETFWTVENVSLAMVNIQGITFEARMR